MRLFDEGGALARRPAGGRPAPSATPRGGANRLIVRPTAEQALRVLGALAVLAVGAVHLQQYLTLYSAIPTIGTLFVLNFAGATAIGLGLLAPLGRAPGSRSRALVTLLALGGMGLAATSFVFLLVSERTPLFGFMEPGYDPAAILASRAAETAAVVFLASFLVLRLMRTRAGR